MAALLTPSLAAQARLSALDRWALTQPGLFGDVVAGRFEMIDGETSTRRGLAAILDALTNVHRCSLSAAERTLLGASAADIASFTRYLLNRGGQYDIGVAFPRATHPEFIRTVQHVKEAGCGDATTRLLMVNLFTLLKHRATGTHLASVRREPTMIAGWSSSPEFPDYLQAMRNKGLDWKPVYDAVQSLARHGTFHMLHCEYGIDGIPAEKQQKKTFRFWKHQSPIGKHLSLPAVEGAVRDPLFTSLAVPSCPLTLADAEQTARRAMARYDVIGPAPARRDRSKDPPTWLGAWRGNAKRPYFSVPIVITLRQQNGAYSAHLEASGLRGPIAMELDYRGNTVTIPGGDGRLSFEGRITDDNSIEGTLSVALWNPSSVDIVLRR